jgi:HSP20 family protein
MLLQELAELNWFPMAGPSIRLEEHHNGDRYIVRAELPGIDPDRDIDITIADGTLRLVVVRLPDVVAGAHSQFRYGTFQRLVKLPAGTSHRYSVDYHEGILEIAIKPGESPELTSPAAPQDRFR